VECAGGEKWAELAVVERGQSEDLVVRSHCGRLHAEPRVGSCVRAVRVGRRSYG
jgi:hypothetical protein